MPTGSHPRSEEHEAREARVQSGLAALARLLGRMAAREHLRAIAQPEDKEDDSTGQSRGSIGRETSDE